MRDLVISTNCRDTRAEKHRDILTILVTVCVCVLKLILTVFVFFVMGWVFQFGETVDKIIKRVHYYYIITTVEIAKLTVWV